MHHAPGRRDASSRFRGMLMMRQTPCAPADPTGTLRPVRKDMMDQTTRILIVDDDAGLRQVMTDFLEGHGLVVEQAASAAQMRESITTQPFDVIILDVMMPGEDGLSVLATLPYGSRPPIILHSVLGTDIDRIVGIEAGAEDYLPKPSNPRELLARIRALVRRERQRGLPEGGLEEGGAQDIAHFSGWCLNRTNWSLMTPDGRYVDLSPTEFRLVSELVRRAGRLASRDSLVEAIRGDDADVYDRTIDVTVSRLRKKLAEYGGEGLIRTLRGEGYMLVLQPHMTN